MKWLALAGLPRVLAESDADPVAVPPGRIEPNCEATIKEGMLDEASLIMVVDKSAANAVNSFARLRSLTS